MSICIYLDNLSIKDEEKIVRDVRVKKIEKSYNPKTGFNICNSYSTHL